MNHGTGIEGSYRERRKRIVKCHVVALLNRHRNLNIGCSILSHPESKVIRCLNITDNVIEFDKTNSKHGFLVGKDIRDDSCSSLWCKTSSVFELSVFNDEPFALKLLCDGATVLTFSGVVLLAAAAALPFVVLNCMVEARKKT
jgi:hypothetical protein